MHLFQFSGYGAKNKDTKSAVSIFVLVPWPPYGGYGVERFIFELENMRHKLDIVYCANF